MSRSQIHIRSTDFYRPNLQDIPWHLLPDATVDAAIDPASVDLDFTRVLALMTDSPPTALGAYGMQRLDEQHFELRFCVIEPSLQGQGLGRRLFGHALGLAESKGGRRVDLRVPTGEGRTLTICERYGFVPVAAEAISDCVLLRFELPPE